MIFAKRSQCVLHIPLPMNHGDSSIGFRGPDTSPQPVGRIFAFESRMGGTKTGETGLTCQLCE